MFFIFILILSVTFNLKAIKLGTKINKAILLLQEALVLLRSIEESDDMDDNQFEEGLKQLKQNQFELSRTILLPFSKKEDKIALKALYWIGVSFLSEKNYEKAMTVFTHFFNKWNYIIDNILDKQEENFTKKSNAQNELLEMKKLAYKHLVLCFIKIRRPEDASAILQKIQEEYPEEGEYVKFNEKLLTTNIRKNS